MTDMKPDFLLEGKVTLYQPDVGYRAAIDAVFLAAACPVKPGQTVLEVGLGTGAASLCLTHRVENIAITGLEVQPELAALARKNVAANNREGITVLDGNLLSPPPELKPGSFDHVITNPPYVAQGNTSPHPSRALAYAEGEADLQTWISFCLSRLKHKGILTMIHRADRVDEIIKHLQGPAGDITIIPLWPKHGVAAKRVIIRARKGVRTPATLHPGLILHQSDGSYTSSAQATLRDGGFLL